MAYFDSKFSRSSNLLKCLAYFAGNNSNKQDRSPVYPMVETNEQSFAGVNRSLKSFDL
jgi:hypothetical protein